MAVRHLTLYYTPLPPHILTSNTGKQKNWCLTKLKNCGWSIRPYLESESDERNVAMSLHIKMRQPEKIFGQKLFMFLVSKTNQEINLTQSVHPALDLGRCQRFDPRSVKTKKRKQVERKVFDKTVRFFQGFISTERNPPQFLSRQYRFDPWCTQFRNLEGPLNTKKLKFQKVGVGGYRWQLKVDRHFFLFKKDCGLQS